MISILAYILSFMYIDYILPSPPSSFSSTRVMHMIMMATGIPPKHIQQGSKVVLGETPCQNSGHRGFSRIYSPCCRGQSLTK